ncbi:MAG: VWA domain-containing protein [Solirubrobacteraceae bacterium]|nr:VWA domain-containing protein [Solirubrobacteraceae bacterium]MDP1850684.1 VWA domain-containing protein [Solirubrobacteraceae bacterium]
MTHFPLSAIVGQEALIESLLINAVAPNVGGVLVRGERGTAKSTAVRALAPLLPAVHAATGETFAFRPGELAPNGEVAHDAPTVPRPAPLVELPLGTTLDRLVGSLDLGRALAGEQAFEAGLLARAHQGILYVDEVNLLPDHLVDALLDAAATGVARVEREAVSAVHAARFLLVGTMNVEEGELRPQLLDRFGLGVEVSAQRDRSQRAEIVRRRLAFEHAPLAFARTWADAESALTARIAAARERLDGVRLPERELLRITGACAALGVDGVRGDIVCAQAARALAALDDAREVDESHVRRAAALALAHRRRRDPLDGRMPQPEELERALDDAGRPPDEPPRGGGNGADGGGRRHAPQGAGTSAEPGAVASTAAEAQGGDSLERSSSPPDAPELRGPQAHADDGHRPPAPGERARERRDAPAPAHLPLDALAVSGTGAGPAGRRARSSGRDAGAIDSRPAGPGGEDVALVASLRGMLLGGITADGALREHVRAGREATLVCLVVDASGSMGARRRLARVKGALLALLRDAYTRRDRVAVIAFRDSTAQLLVAPGAPLALAAAALRGLPTGGRTPLAAGLDAAELLIRRETLREPGRRAIAVVLTDGRVCDPAGEIPRAAARLGRAAAATHVVDTEDGPVRLGLAAALACAAGGHVHRLALVTASTRSAA